MLEAHDMTIATTSTNVKRWVHLLDGGRDSIYHGQRNAIAKTMVRNMHHKRILRAILGCEKSSLAPLSMIPIYMLHIGTRPYILW